MSARDTTSTYFQAQNEEGAAEVEGKPEVTEEKPAGNACPWPTAVVWWQTKRRQDRAIVGYSDGSVCFLCKFGILFKNGGLIIHRGQL